MRWQIPLYVTLALLVVAIAVPATAAAGERASGSFVDGSGNTIGDVKLEQLADGSVKIALALNNANVVKAGIHGIHFHAVGQCAGPDFMSAGGHFNPTGKQHGTKNPQGSHAGDLPNLPIDNTTALPGGGYGASMTTKAVTLSSGALSIFDADGTALVIHASPDDEMTDPAGNSGARVACAVLKSAPALPATGGGAAAEQRTRQQALLLALVVLTLTAVIGLSWRRRARA